MKQTARRLADGREIIYYDRRGCRTDPPPDRRILPTRAHPSTVRRDLATGDSVIVAAHRQVRLFQPAENDCPLCPSRDGRLTEIPAADYDVVVFENRFPALSQVGRCEVVCFTSAHRAMFAELSDAHARLILDVWADRTRVLREIPGVVQVFCFENRGPEMGVSQPHPHGQIYAYPYVTPRTARMLRQARAYRREHGRNVFDDLVAAELRDGRRVVRAMPEWVAFVPFAARWPYEVHLYPRRRCADLTSLDEAQRDGFAEVYLDLLRRFDRLFESGATPYVSAWHQAPAAAGADDVALHLELFTNRRAAGRLKVLGGTEVAMDAFSNDVGAEAAADRLREVGQDT